MKVADFFIALGLDVDSASVAEGVAAVALVEKALGGLRIIAIEALHGLRELIIGTAEAGDHIKELSERVGVNAEELQRMAYGAEQSGVDMDTLAMAMGRLAKSGVKDVQGGMLKLADQLEKLPEDGSRAKLAMEKFGKAGAALVPFLSKGRKEIEKLGIEADETGGIFSKDALLAADHFSDAMDAMRFAITGVVRTIGVPMIEALTPVIRAFRNWVVQNRKMVALRFTTFVKVLTVALTILWDHVLRPLGGVLGVLIERFDKIAAIIAGLLIPTVLKLGAAWVLANLPLIGMAAIVALVILALEDLWTFLEGGDSLFGRWIEKTFGKDMVTKVREILTHPKQAFFDFVEGVKEDFRLLGQSIQMSIKDAFNNLVIGAKEKLAELTKWLNEHPVITTMLKVAGNMVGPMGAVDAGMTAALMGGGASPSASTAAAAGTGPGVVMPNINIPITVNATEAQDERAIAGQVAEQARKLLETIMSDAAAAANGG